MGAIQITKDMSHAEMEELLVSGALSSAGLKIPNNLKHAGAMGTSVAFAQFLLTWARSSKDRTLSTYLTPGDEEGFKAFTGRVHGLAAAYFADKVESANGTDIRRALLESARDRIQAMHVSDIGNTARGSEIEFIFVQGAKAQFHGALYSRAPTETESSKREEHGQLIEGPVVLNALIARCSRELGLENKLHDTVASRETPMGWLLHEAFRNTAEHAYVKPKGGRLVPNLRCVRMSRNYVNRDDVSSASISAPESRARAAHYFKRTAGMASNEQRAQIMFFEMSVFDCGEGFASTIGETAPAGGESHRDAVVRCFRLHSTAKQGRNSGLGLNRILKEVHALDGFLRVRTNTVEAFYAPVDDLTPDCSPELYVHGGLAPVQGTVLTVAIPVGV